MIGTLIIGGLAGWLTGKFTKGEGYGILMNIGLGILGGWFGGWLFGILGLGTWRWVYRQTNSGYSRCVYSRMGV